MAKKESGVGLSLSFAFCLMLVGLYLTQQKDENDWVFIIGLLLLFTGALLARKLTE